MSNLTEVLAAQALARPEQPAIVHGHGRRERVISFGQLAREVELAAAGWRTSRLAPGEAVLIFHPMSVDLYVALLGLLRAGLVAVFVDPRAGLGQLAYAREKLPPRAILASAGTRWLCRLLPALWGAGPALTPAQLRKRGLAADSPLRALAPTEAETPALVTWTSGSTGRPKGIVRSHGFLLAQHLLLERHLHLEPGQVDLTALPIFTLANLASGVTSVLAPGAASPATADPAALAQQIQRWAITRGAGSPALFARLAACPGAVRQLRELYLGGAPVFPRLLAQLQALNPELRLTSVYGSTEAEPIAESVWGGGPRHLTGRGLYQGKAVPEVQLAVLPDRWGTPLREMSAEDFAARRLPVGAPGEIVIAGDHVIPGYLGGIGEAETKFRVAGRVWHRTGDAGYLDAEGGLWLLGRCSALSPLAAGAPPRQVDDYPFAVEVACLAPERPEVARAALVEMEGRRILALQPAAPQTDYAPWLARLRKVLAWARIDEFRIVPEIPLDKRHQAKIDYPQLRRILR